MAIFLFLTYAILQLIYVAKNLAADLQVGSLFVCHNTFGRGNDGDTKSVNNSRHVFVAGVAAETRGGYSLKTLDGVLTRGGVILQGHLDSTLRTILDELVVQDVTLLEEDLRDFLLQVRRPW